MWHWTKSLLDLLSPAFTHFFAFMSRSFNYLLLAKEAGGQIESPSFSLLRLLIDQRQHFTNLAFHFTFIAAWGWDEEIKPTITSLVDGVRVHEACENVTIDNKIRQQLSSMQRAFFFIILYHHGMSSFDVIQRRKFHSFHETVSRWFQILHDVFFTFISELIKSTQIHKNSNECREKNLFYYDCFVKEKKKTSMPRNLVSHFT